jgi:hypothetical protein
MEHIEPSTSTMVDTTVGRRFFSLEERKVLVDIYDSTDDKTTAMLLVNNASQNGEQIITERRIKRWKKSGNIKIPGRPLSVEFEEEVIAECERIQLKESSSVSLSTCTHEFIKMCAINVFNKDYWDNQSSSFIKIWHHDKKTCNLRFSNRWVIGLMQRVSKRRIVTSYMSTTSRHHHDEALGLSSVDQKKPTGDDAAMSKPGCNVECQTNTEEMDIIALFQDLDAPMDNLSGINDYEFLHIFDVEGFLSL